MIGKQTGEDGTRHEINNNRDVERTERRPEKIGWRQFSRRVIRETFRRFRKYLTHEDPYFTRNSFWSQYRCLLCGSSSVQWQYREFSRKLNAKKILISFSSKISFWYSQYDILRIAFARPFFNVIIFLWLASFTSTCSNRVLACATFKNTSPTLGFLVSC